LDGELKRRIRWSEGPELAVIDALSVVQLHKAAVWRIARDRLILGVVATLGARIGAFAQLRVSDYEPEHEFPDGAIGPALALRPGKTEHPDLVRWKGLSTKDQEVVEVFLRIGERLYMGLEYVAGSVRVLREPRPMPEVRYLLPPEIWRPDKEPNAQAMSNRLAGKPAQGCRPLLRRPARGGVEQRGYSSHSLRHLSEQIIKDASAAWLRERNIGHVSAQAIADAVHDHRIAGDAYGYGDVNSEAGRETWARVGIGLASAYIWGPAGAPRAPDVAAYERAFRRQLALEDEVRRATRCVAAAETNAAKKGEDAGHQDVVALLRATTVERQARIALEEARDECEQLRNDEDTWLAIEDTPEAPRVDLSTVEEQIRAGVPADAGGSPSRLRNWLTVTEMSKLFAVSPATARRWVEPGKPPKHLPGLTVDVSCGRKRRRVLAESLSPDRLTNGQTEMLAEMLGQWPLEENWSQKDRETPLAKRRLRVVEVDSGTTAGHADDVDWRAA
jgi:hypothetical protein